MNNRNGKNIISQIFETISACMKPVIPVLIAGGLIKLVIILINLTGAFSVLGDTKNILTVLGDAPFYYLPILVALSSAKYFKVNPLCALVSVSVMLHPDFVKLMESKELVAFLGIPVYKTSYSYSVLPIILLIYIMSLIIKGLERVLPQKIKEFIVPVLSILITALLGILLIGPVMAFLSNYLSDGLSFLQIHYPILAWAVIDAILPLLIITGMHWVFVAIAITQLGVKGYENGFLVGCFIMCLALSASAFAVFLKSKISDRKKVAMSSGITTFLTGTSEPCLFGVCLPYRIPLITTMIAGGIAGFYQGLVTIHSYVYAFPAIISILMFSSPDEPDNLLKAAIAGSIGFIAAFLLTIIIYKDKNEEIQTEADN
jgi:PTS system beta-glucosides-specific IIC component